MPLDRSFLDGVSRWRLAVAAVVVPLVLALPVVTDGPVTPALVGVVVLGAGWIVASVFDAVREHESYGLANAIWFVAVGSLLLVQGDGVAPLPALFLGLGIVGAVAETYNLRNGTSYLRFES